VSHGDRWRFAGDMYGAAIGLHSPSTATLDAIAAQTLMRAPTLRRGAFFVAGAAWVLHAQPETVEVVATAGATAMRGGSRQYRTGECTATAGMGQQRRLSEFTVGPLAPNTHGQGRRTATPVAVGSRNGRGSVGPIASAPFPMGSTGRRMPSAEEAPWRFCSRRLELITEARAQDFKDTLLGTGNPGAQPAVVAWQGRCRLSVCDWRAGPHGAKAMTETYERWRHDIGRSRSIRAPS
jgi:hypothetical protein